MIRALTEKLGRKLRERREALRTVLALLRNPQQTQQALERSESEITQARLKQTMLRQGILAIGTVAMIAVLLFTVTAAWYTNVSKTGSMAFRTESWGFNPDNIYIASQSDVPLLPGTVGVVPLTIDNSEGADRIKATVTISKETMNRELQKRIFFYADTSGTKNGEVFSPIYLGNASADGYSYELSPGEVLTLSEDYYSGVPLRWMWVYDLLGYYFRGTVGDTVTENEYLRPIEYDLDSAVFDENGYLTSAESKPTAALLTEISLADGYEGQITAASRRSVDGRYYYPVDVDSNGYGVWAYLLTQSEIEAAGNYDNQLGNVDLVATVTVTVQNLSTHVETASTLSELSSLINDSSVDVIKLTNDIELNSTLTVPSYAKLVIDLDGHTILFSDTQTQTSAISVGRDTNLTLMNGTLQDTKSISSGTSNTTRRGVRSVGAQVTLSDMHIQGFSVGVAIDDSTVAVDSTVRITGCTITTPGTGIYMVGNATGTDSLSRLILQDSTVSGDYVGISGSRGPSSWGTEIIAVDSSISGEWAGVFHPQQKSIAQFSGCSISGYTGLVVKGGTVTVSGGSVAGVGEELDDSAPSASGWADTAGGIYVEANHDWPAAIVVKGDAQITSEQGYAVDLYGEENKGPGRITLQGGSYQSAPGLTSARWNGLGVLDLGSYIAAGDVTNTGA